MLLLGTKELGIFQIRYDKRNMNQIYILDSTENRFIICSLRPEEEVFFDRSYEEIIDYNKFEKLRQDAFTKEQSQIDIDMNHAIKTDVEKISKTQGEKISNKNDDQVLEEEKREQRNNMALQLQDTRKDKVEAATRNNDFSSTEDSSRDFFYEALDNCEGSS